MKNAAKNWNWMKQYTNSTLINSFMRFPFIAHAQNTLLANLALGNESLKWDVLKTLAESK